MSDVMASNEQGEPTSVPRRFPELIQSLYPLAIRIGAVG